MLTVACGGPEADWVYGTWSEALTGETVEFKSDKALRWFNGAEGSFSFKRNDDILCNFTSCPDGILVLSVDNQTFRFGYQVNDGAYEWTLRVKNRAGLCPAEQTVLGLPTDTLVLKRGNVAAYAPESFVEAGEGLERLYASISGGGVVNGEIVGTFYSQNSFSAVFNRDTNQWQRLSRAGQSIGGDVELGQKVILDRGFGASNAFSLDTGASWGVFPGINEAVSGAIRTRAKFIDTVVYQIIENPFEDGNRDYNEARPQWLYRLNLSVAAPAWERVFEFPSNFTTDRYYLEILTHEERNEIYVIAKASNEELAQSAPVVVLRSRDGGASFDEMPLPTGVTSQSEARIYDGGLVFSEPDYESKHLNSLWYVAEKEMTSLRSYQGAMSFSKSAPMVLSLPGP